MIRKLLLSTVATVAIGGAALAADLPSRRAPPVYVPPIPIFSWTGFYVGGQVGFGFGQDRYRFASPPARTVVAGDNHPNGFIGGAHIGYNFSTQSLPLFGGLANGIGGGLFGAGGLVLGVEGDIDGSDYRVPVGVANLGTSNSLRSTIQGSARGRLGFAVDRALFYATGGAAFAQFEDNFSGVPGVAGFSAPNHTRVGYTVGGGIEYAITTQWSLRAEYRYSDFGTFRDTLTPAVVLNRHEIMERAQVGFSYKFDNPVAPVVARY